MKHIAALLILLTFMLSCSNRKITVENLLLKEDMRGAEIISYGLDSNSEFSIAFSEKVEITEISFNGRKERRSLLGSSFTISLPEEISMGEKAELALTYSKNGGNTNRALFTLYGKNGRKAGLLINELSIKGTGTNPDRIELLVTESGNTAGMTVTDDPEETGAVLPAIEVSRGDIIVIWWDSRSGKTAEEREDGGWTYHVDAQMKDTLISTTGGILLYDEAGGNIEDAVIYSDSSSSAVREKYSSMCTLLSEEGAWEGDAVASDEVTPSRVLARLPGGIDSNTASDWFITAARKSTFGDKNIYAPYE